MRRCSWDIFIVLLRISNNTSLAKMCWRLGAFIQQQPTRKKMVWDEWKWRGWRHMEMYVVAIGTENSGKRNTSEQHWKVFKVEFCFTRITRSLKFFSCFHSIPLSMLLCVAKTCTHTHTCLSSPELFRSWAQNRDWQSNFTGRQISCSTKTI